MKDTSELNSETKILSLADLQNDGQKFLGLYFVLTVIEGTNFGYMFQLEKTETIVGRKDNEATAKPDIEIDDDRSSRQHICFIKKKSNTDQAYYALVKDLGSKNGTYINGKKLTEEVELYNGDKIQIGNTVFKVDIKDSLDFSSFQEKVYQQVTKDQLTGLWNHHHVKKEIEKLISIGNRLSVPFAVAVFEIDFLQTLNETYGRSVGDEILRSVAKRIMIELSDYEIAARFGGSQYLIALPESDLTTATNFAEKIRQAIETFDTSSLGCPQKITLSGGVSQFPICGRSSEELIKKADEALYQAKQIGRNRICKAEIVFQEKVSIVPKLLLGLIVVLALGAITFTAIKFYPTLSVKEESNLVFYGTVQTQEVLVSSKVGGRVKEVLVEEGDIVEPNELIVKFDIEDLLSQRKLIEAKIVQQQANLAKLRQGFQKEEIEAAQANVRKEKAILEQLYNGPRPQEIAQVKADLLGAESDFANSESFFNRIDELFKRGYCSEQEYDDAKNKLQLAKAKVEVIKEKLGLLREGTRQEEIQTSKERIKQAESQAELLIKGSRHEDVLAAEAELKVIEAELEQLNIKILEGQVLAPAQARVQTIKVRPGDVLASNRPVAELLELDQMWVRIYVPESDLGKIKIGEEVLISVDSFAGKFFLGHIQQISEQAEFYPRNVQSSTDRQHQVFGVKVSIENKDGKLKSGMSVEVKLKKN